MKQRLISSLDIINHEKAFKYAIGSAGGLVILWKESEVLVEVLEQMSNYMICIVYSLRLRCQSIPINVYEPIKTKEKALTWTHMKVYLVNNGMPSVIISGDFDVIRHLKEKNGGQKKINKCIEDFKNFVEDLKLVNCTTTNGVYTWTNRRSGFKNILE